MCSLKWGIKGFRLLKVNNGIQQDSQCDGQDRRFWL